MSKTLKAWLGGRYLSTDTLVIAYTKKQAVELLGIAYSEFTSWHNFEPYELDVHESPITISDIGVWDADTLTVDGHPVDTRCWIKREVENA